MGKKITIQAAPKWLKEKPDAEKKKLIKENAYEYLSTIALKGEMLESSTMRIPGYISFLTEFDSDFGKIKDEHMVTTNAFIEAIRVEIKNNITKIEKEIKAGTLLVGDDDNEDKSAAENQSKQDDESSDKDSAQCKHSEEVEVEESDQIENISSKSKKLNEFFECSICRHSKKILKDDTHKYFKDLQKRHPDKWQELHVLRETVKSKMWELEYFTSKYEKKAKQCTNLMTPKMNPCTKAFRQKNNLDI